MAMLTAILTHLDARLVEKQLAYVRELAPDARFVICHGGRRADFDALAEPDALFIEDPSLRGPHFDQSRNDTLRALYETRVRDDAAIDLVYVVEYDHLILRADFEQTLEALAERTGAGLLAKWASPRNDSNWSHYLRARENAQLNAFVETISHRDDPGVRLGCLGTGLLFQRDAFSAFCTLDDLPSSYFELLIPTAVHHLGFDVVDVDAVDDLYTAVRWLPQFDVEGAIAEKRSGRTFVHPFKQIDALDSVRDA
jgi:hypothetical protein